MQSTVPVGCESDFVAEYLAILGLNYDIELSAKPGYGNGTHTGTAFLGFANRMTPLVIPPFGTLYLAPPVFGLPALTIPHPSGVATIPLALPVVPLFVGVELYFQALIVDDGNPADARLTGYTVDAMRN